MQSTGRPRDALCPPKAAPARYAYAREDRDQHAHRSGPRRALHNTILYTHTRTRIYARVQGKGMKADRHHEASTSLDLTPLLILSNDGTKVPFTQPLDYGTLLLGGITAMGQDDANTGSSGEQLAQTLSNFMTLKPKLKKDLLDHILSEKERLVPLQQPIAGMHVPLAPAKVTTKTFDGIMWYGRHPSEPTSLELLQAWNDGKVMLAEVKSTNKTTFPMGSPTSPQLYLEHLFKDRYRFVCVWVNGKRIEVLDFNEMSQHRLSYRAQYHQSKTV